MLGPSGSGKTTLLAKLLRDPALARTAVIINEFGEIPLDHDLIETSDEQFVQLSNGCLCCKVRSDLTLTLGELAARRKDGSLPPFERVVIETSGLADPAPILHALMTDRDLCGIYSLDGVITTADAVIGLGTLDQHEESRRQAAVADRIVITKSDLSQASTDALRQRLAAMNPGASVTEAAMGAISPALLFGCGIYDLAGKNMDVAKWLAQDSPHPVTSGDHPHASHVHTSSISSFCIVREQPLHAVTLPLLLSALAENCGADLLRVKGIVHVRESPERPAVIHGVQHVYHAPAWLPRWPSADHRTRLVFIGRNLRETWVRMLIDLLDDEVAQVGASAHHA